MKTAIATAITFLLVIGSLLFVKRASFINSYYSAKYHTASVSAQYKPVAAEKIVKSNPFFANRYIILVDIKQSKNAKRLSVYDLSTHKVVYSAQAMHGKGSGKDIPSVFSNEVNSNCTALGKYVVVGEYSGKYGKTYRLAGLDKTNSNTLARHIVLHKTKYITANSVSYSQGCPAVSANTMNALHKYVQEGTLLWIY